MVKNKKRGAIELSMTTIIVIVIGIGLLSFGLMWVSGLGKKIKSMTETAFGKADVMIGEVMQGETEDISVSPDKVDLKARKGEKVEVDVIINNRYGDEIKGRLKVECDNEGIEPEYYKKEYTLEPGKKMTHTLIIKYLRAAKDSTIFCTVEFGEVEFGDFSKELVVNIV